VKNLFYARFFVFLPQNFYFMKKILLFSIFIFAVKTIFSQTDSLQQMKQEAQMIMDSYLDSLGGESKIRNIENLTVEFSAIYSLQNQTIETQGIQYFLSNEKYAKLIFMFAKKDTLKSSFDTSIYFRKFKQKKVKWENNRPFVSYITIDSFLPPQEYFFDSIFQNPSTNKPENLFVYKGYVFVQKEIFDGKMIFDSTSQSCVLQNDKNLIFEMQYQTYLVPEIFYKKMKIVICSVEQTSLNGKPVDKITVVTQGSVRFANYYDSNLRLKLRTEKIIQGEVVETIDYQAYSEVDLYGIRLCTKKKIQTREFSIEINLRNVDFLTKIKSSVFDFSKKTKK